MRTLGNSATLTAAAALTTGTAVNVAAFNHASIQVSGTFVGEVTFMASLNGVTWYEAVGHDITDANHGLAKKVTAPKIIQFRELAGVQFLRADVTSYTSGSITAIVNAVA